jgi:hypothetical protein
MSVNCEHVCEHFLRPIKELASWRGQSKEAIGAIDGRKIRHCLPLLRNVETDYVAISEHVCVDQKLFGLQSACEECGVCLIVSGKCFPLAVLILLVDYQHNRQRDSTVCININPFVG